MADTNASFDKSSANSTTGLARGLGWFSIGLGFAEMITPSAVAGLIGVRDDRKTRGLLRSYGMREIAAGIGILGGQKTEGWLWSRVAGDALDLSSLASAFTTEGNGKGRLLGATAAVVGVTALDILCAQSLHAEKEAGDAKQAGSPPPKKATKATQSLAIDRSPEEAYAFWRNFENLPKFMTYLESVRNSGDRLSHWTAIGPAGLKIEWDAELTEDRPNRMIAWRSVRGAAFENAGSVRFEPFPGRAGCIVRVEMDVAPNGGVLNSSLGKVIGSDVGRRILHDLRNFKQVLEVGEVTQSDASIHEGMHAAQPSELQPA